MLNSCTSVHCKSLVHTTATVEVSLYTDTQPDCSLGSASALPRTSARKLIEKVLELAPSVTFANTPAHCTDRMTPPDSGLSPDSAPRHCVLFGLAPEMIVHPVLGAGGASEGVEHNPAPSVTSFCARKVRHTQTQTQTHTQQCMHAHTP